MNEARGLNMEDQELTKYGCEILDVIPRSNGILEQVSQSIEHMKEEILKMIT